MITLTPPLRVMLLSVMLLSSAWANARTLDNVEAVQREARIVADVMKSALRSELRDDVRVTSVSAEYLAKQGVLISVKLNAPWLTIHDGENAIEINSQITLEEIPSMVENILADLQIDITPYEPEALEELRSLRKEQRELRLEQRDIRAKLRSKRRALVRADEDDDRDDVTEDIADLEQELAAVDAQYDALANDIDNQYQELRDYRGGPSTPRTPSPPLDMNVLISRTACDYGGTLKTLSSEDFLTVALRRDEVTQYYAFKMDHVYSCSRGDMQAERLLELSYQYSG